MSAQSLFQSLGMTGQTGQPGPDLDRPAYHPSGRVGHAFFALTMPVTAAAALLLAIGMALVLWSGFYFALYVALLAGIALGPVVHWAVAAGHCRSPAFATLFGVLAGALMYLGSYYVDMVHAHGGVALIGVTELPRYIHFRLSNDQWGRPMDVVDAPPPLMISNCLIFAVELLLVVCITGAFARRRATRAYCEEHGCWARREMLILQPGCGPTIVAALKTGDWDKTLARLHEVDLKADCPHCEVVLESCPAADDDHGCCLCLSVREIERAAKVQWGLHNCPQGFLARQVALEQDEWEKIERRLVRGDMDAGVTAGGD